MSQYKSRMPQNITKDEIFDVFINEVCGQQELYVGRELLEISVNYRITDSKYKQKEVVLPEQEGEYTQSPVLEINDVNLFKNALYNYIKAYLDSNSYWADPDIAIDWKSTMMYTMAAIWTNATNQDFTNPVEFLNRYTAFLTQDQWKDLSEPKKIKGFGGMELYKAKAECNDEREAPNNFYLFEKDNDGKKYYFPSIVYGIKDDKAYVYAIHQIYNKSNKETENMQKLRNIIKGRGVEPLGIASLIAFIEEAKQKGIKQIVMPDNFVMQYTTKNKIRRELNKYRAEPEGDERIDKNHMGSMNKRLMTMMIISKYYSTGIKFTEIPGEVSDNYTADIQDFKIGREQKINEDPRKNGRNNKEER